MALCLRNWRTRLHSCLDPNYITPKMPHLRSDSAALRLCMELGHGRTESVMQNILLVYWGGDKKFASRLCFISLVSQKNDDTHVTHLEYEVPWTPVTVHYKITLMCLFLFYNFRSFPLGITQLPKVRRKFNLGTPCLGLGSQWWRNTLTTTAKGLRTNHCQWDP